jgi:outer membrane protein assembly factor BamB
MKKKISTIQIKHNRNSATAPYLYQFQLILLVLALIFSLMGISLLTASTIQWRYQPVAGFVDSSPAVCDLDGDDVLDLVICTTAGRVLTLDSKGNRKWFFDVGGTISSPPTILGDQNPKIVVITNPGKIACLNGKSGSRMWEMAMPGEIDWGSTAIAVADLNGNGRQQIVATDRGGHMICLDENGTTLWMTKQKFGFNSAPALVDLDGDGQVEILFGSTASALMCFSYEGKIRWSLKGKGSVGSSPVICDLNGDGTPEILLGQGNDLIAVNRKGKILWRFRMRKQIHDAIAVGDINEDNKAEIVAVDLSGQVVCLTANGRLLWTGNAEQRVRRSPAIADINGDSVMEIIVGGYSSALHIFDSDGNLKERIPLRGAMNSSPTIVDFKGNQRLSIVCATGADVVSYTWMDSKPEIKPLVLWSEYRVNSARTASIIMGKIEKRVRFARVHYGDFYVGINEFCVNVENPKTQILKLEIEISQNGASPFKSKFTSSDSIFQYTLPYSISGKNATNIKFASKIFSGKRLLSSREKIFYIVPFAKDVADLQKTLADTKEQLPGIIDKQYVSDRLMILSNRLKQVDKQAERSGTLPLIEGNNLKNEIVSLRNEATRLLGLAKAASKTGTILSVSGANPWAPFGGIEEFVEGRTAPPELKIEAFGGETESAALNLSNFSSRSLIVRVEPEPIYSELDSSLVQAANVFSFHEVLPVPTEATDFPYSADALPLLGQANTLIIPPWENRQLWIKANVSALCPGKWKTKIRFRTLETESQEAEANIFINVWKTHLPEKQSLKLCHWGYVHTSILKDQPQAALNDQVDHGTNVFVATNTFVPKANYDENGILIGEIDFSQHDKYVRQHSPHGIILFFNYQASLKCPAQKFSPQWIKAYKHWLKFWIDHMLKIGVGYEDYAFYPIDEPGLREGLVEAFIAYSKPIREVDAKAQIYTDPVERATMSDLKSMAPYVDIWCPNRNGYLLEKGGEKLTFLKSIGKTVWTYECEGNAKLQSPLGYYRAQSWLVWSRGLTGIGFWSYCTSRYDPWYTPAGGHDYLLIYQGNGVVTSKRWEAVRDGIEDYSMLQQLKDAIENASDKPELAATIEAAKKVLGEDASIIAHFCGLEKAGTKPGIAGLGKVREVEDVRWEKIKDVRRKIAKIFEALSE